MNDDLGLEALIDAHGLEIVLQKITKICAEKAEHLRTNWQDENGAIAWENAYMNLDGLTGSTEGIWDGEWRKYNDLQA